MDIGGGTLQYTTRHSRNQNLQRFTMGRVKGLELRAIPILEPWELSPWGRNLRHFVVEGITHTYMYIYILTILSLVMNHYINHYY